jgi:soluble lytic murein transglycosylase-like protein
VPAVSWCADVYRSESADGVVRFATQPLDDSYVLFLRDPARVAAPDAPPSAAPAAMTARQAALEPHIASLARKHGVDAALVRAVIEVESGFNPKAVSKKGAVGAMQLMPATGARYGVTQREDPAQNIDGGIRYLKDLLARHDGNVALALAAYNAGEGAVARHGKSIPPYKETMLYVPAVLARMQALRGQTPAP